MTNERRLFSPEKDAGQRRSNLMLNSTILSTLILLPLIGGFVLLFVPAHYKDTIKGSALLISLITFVLSLYLWAAFDNSTARFQYVEVYNWIENSNINFVLGVDGISLFFVLLTTLLVPICILASFDAIKKNMKEFMIAFLVLESLVIAAFVILDLLLFYVFFEAVLIPMFIIIGVWGSRERKVRAAYLFFMYTLLGSVFMLLGILWIYYTAGTTDYQLLLTTEFSEDAQKLLFLAFFASFAAKVPMIGLHLWLTEAHVEAPTAGSVILAGILLKLGTYGFIRFSLPLFPVASMYFTPLMYTVSVIGVIYAALTAMRQTDLKRIVAYSSVSHMGLIVIGIFSMNAQGLEGSIIQQLSHGLVSGALFLCVGVVYDRAHTRLVKYYSGLVQTMPVYITIFMLFTMANIALPGTSSFVGEFLILVGIFQANPAVCFFAATGMVLGGGYALWLFNRMAFGNIKSQYQCQFVDLNTRELATFLPLIVLTLVMGIYPEIFLDPMHVSVNNLNEHVRIQL